MWQKWGKKYNRIFIVNSLRKKRFKIRTWPRKVKFSFQNKIISGTKSGLKISLPWAVGSCALSSGDLVTWVRCRKRTCNAPIYSSSDYCQTVGGLVNTSPADTMLPKAAIVALKGLLAWSNFISALDTRIKAYCTILLRTRNDLVFQLADYPGMRLLLLIYPLYIWLPDQIYMRPAEETRNNWTGRNNLCRFWSYGEWC